MVEILKNSHIKKVMDLSGDVQEVALNYKQLILSGLFGINPDNPAELIDALDAYRKTH